MYDDILPEEARAFDQQIIDRVKAGHVPDLRRCAHCDYFYNNVWRDQSYVGLYFGAVVKRVIGDLHRHGKPGKSGTPLRILEVGSGPGHVALELARNGFDVKGIDLSKACIDIAEKVAAEDPWREKRGPLQYQVADFFNVTGTYDAVLFVAALHHFPDANRVIAHAAGLLHSGGLIIADEPLRDMMSHRNASVIFLTKALLSASHAYFEKVELPENEKELKRVLEALYTKEKYETEDHHNVQSPNDNSSTSTQMYDALTRHTEQVEFEKLYALYHQLIGGLRLPTEEENRKLAAFIKLIDAALCQHNAIDPMNFYYVGRKA